MIAGITGRSCKTRCTPNYGTPNRKWVEVTDTYVFQENTGGDLLIKLVNLTGITSISKTGGSANTIWIG